MRDCSELFASISLIRYKAVHQLPTVGEKPQFSTVVRVGLGGGARSGIMRDVTANLTVEGCLQ